MKIAFLVPSFPCVSETFILTQVKGLLDLGHEITIYGLKPPEPSLNRAAEDRYGSLRCAQTRLGDAFGPRILRGLALAGRNAWRRPVLVGRSINPFRFGLQALSFATLQAAAPVFDRPRFDVVHCHFGPTGVIGAMLRDLGLLRAPLVVTFYGHDVTRYPLRRGHGVYRRIATHADLILALDPLMRSRLIDLGMPEARVQVHPLSVECGCFRPSDNRPAQPPLRLFSVGRFVEKKGFADGLRAVAALKGDAGGIEYRIAGDGPLRDELHELSDRLGLAKIVTFLGAVSHDRVARELADAHALVAPSVRAADGDEEGTPTVIIEAMACGVPVIATRHSGIPFLVEDGESGWLVDEHDHADLARRIDQIRDQRIRERMGRKARCVALQRFDSARLASVLEGRYRSLRGDAAHAPASNPA